MASEQTENELKYAVDQRFRLPNLAKLVPAGGRIDRSSVTLDSVYYDTADHDLLGHGVTLRSRAGDTDAGWQLKVPDGGAVRTEIRLDPTGSRTAVPGELLHLTSGLRRGAEVRHIATIRTHRDIQRVLDDKGNVLVEVADDHVHSSAPTPDGALLQEWREIEAEFGDTATPDVVAAVDKKLIKGGASRAATQNKVVHALNGGASPTKTAKGSRTSTTAGSVVSQYLREQDEALVTGDLTLRRGRGGIHPTRVGTRRLRSTLRIFGALFDAERAAAFDAELSWYADVLGQVRDREVQRVRMRELVSALPDELVLGPVAARIEQQLVKEQTEAQHRLDEVMKTERYFALLQQSREWATQPPFTSKASAKPAALIRYVSKAEQKLLKHLAAGLEAAGDDEELHKARKAGKRARYAAELAGAVLGKKKAKSKVAKYQKLQDTLGDHQDGVVSSELMRRLGAGTANEPGENGFTYGLIFAQEMERATKSRRQAAQQFAALKR